MKKIVTVILYNKRIEESITLEGLRQLDSHFTLVIINNGPKEVELGDDYALKNKNSTIQLLNILDNRPLSFLYNSIFNECPDADCYIFLDDDTILSDDFLDFDYVEADLIVPYVVDAETNKLRYPVINGDIPSKIENRFVKPSEEIISIGSGMIISRSLVKKILSVYRDVFDENYALYGVDYSLFRRFERLKKTGDGNIVKCKVNGCITHHLSGNGKTAIEPWRYRERLIDIVLTYKYYSNSVIAKYLRLIRLILSEAKRYQFRNIYLIVSVYINGHHPRCGKNN